MADTLPMSEKQVDKVVRPWFIFGTNPTTGNVDVSNEVEDVFTGLPPGDVRRVIEAHHRFREELYSILCKEAT